LHNKDGTKTQYMKSRAKADSYGDSVRWYEADHVQTSFLQLQNVVIFEYSTRISIESTTNDTL